MGEKIDIYRSYGEKLISLFARLLFFRRELFPHGACPNAELLQADRASPDGGHPEGLRGGYRGELRGQSEILPGEEARQHKGTLPPHRTRALRPADVPGLHKPHAGQEALRGGRPRDRKEPGPATRRARRKWPPFRCLPPGNDRLHAIPRDYLQSDRSHGGAEGLPRHV